MAKALHEALDVLVHEGVDGDLVGPLLQLRLCGQLAVDQQVGDLEVGGAFGEILDRVTPVLQDPGVAVEIGDGAAAGCDVGVAGVVDHQAEVRLVGLHLAEVESAQRAVGDRQLV